MGDGPLRRRNKHRDDLSDVRLDEGFVRDAVVVELSAEERLARLRRDQLASHSDEETREAAWGDRRRRRSRRRRRVAALVAMAVGLSFAGWQGVLTRRRLPAPSPTSPDAAVHPAPDRSVYDTELADLPPPSAEEARAPLGQPAAPPENSDRFRFMFVRAGTNTPVAYDPCRPVHLVVNPRTAPPGADAILGEALDALRTATGLHFVEDGVTDEAPSPNRPPYQPDRYPKRWAPVLVAWSDPAESPVLAGPVTGNGGSVAVDVGEDRVYVSGGVTLDGPQLAATLSARGGHAQVRAVLEHELGHLVGLDHVPFPSELMNPVPGVVSFGAGDLSGLAQLGRGPCFPTI